MKENIKGSTIGLPMFSLKKALFKAFISPKQSSKFMPAKTRFSPPIEGSHTVTLPSNHNLSHKVIRDGRLTGSLRMPGVAVNLPIPDAPNVWSIYLHER